MARVPNRITQAHFTHLLTGIRALSWTVFPNELAKVLDEAVRLIRIDADSRSPPPPPPPPPRAAGWGVDTCTPNNPFHLTRTSNS